MLLIEMARYLEAAISEAIGGLQHGWGTVSFERVTYFLRGKDVFVSLPTGSYVIICYRKLLASFDGLVMNLL